MKRTLNWKAALILLGVLIVVGPAVHFIHAFQVKRNAAALLHQADQFEADDDSRKAADYLHRYLGLEPDQSAVLARYALLSVKLAKSRTEKQRAFFTLSQAVRREDLPDDTRDKLRREVVTLAMGLGRFAEACDMLEGSKGSPGLVARHPKEIELLDLLGQCEQGLTRYEKAVERYKEVVKQAPSRIQTYARMAAILEGPLKDPKEPNKALDKLDEMVENNAESHEAYVVRGHFLHERGKLDDAEKDLASARRLVPEETKPPTISRADVLFLSAELAREDNRLKNAREHLRQGLDKYPKDLRFYLALGDLELRTAPPNKPAALHLFHAALKAVPDSLTPETAMFVWNLADLFLEAGAPEEAGKLIARLGDFPAVDYLRARVLAEEGKYALALQMLEKRQQDYAASTDLTIKSSLLIARCHGELGNPDQQLRAYKRALEKNPNLLPARVGEVNVLVTLGRLEQAVEKCRELAPYAPHLKLTIANLLLHRTAQYPVKVRDWSDFKQAMDALTKEQKESVDGQLLQITRHRINDEFIEARRLLIEAIKQHPKEPRFWVPLALLQGLEQPDDSLDLDEALKILNQADKDVGDHVELWLARADVLAQQGAKGREKLVQLEKDAGKFGLGERRRLLRGLSDLYWKRGDNDDSGRVARRLAEEMQFDLEVRLRLLEIALAKDPVDQGSAANWLAELTKVEGSEGVFWRVGHATQLVQGARKLTGPEKARQLTLARTYLTEAGRRRSSWSRVPLLLAEVALQEGNTEEAITRFKNAIELGETDSAVLRRAVQLLTSWRRTEEARELLQLYKRRAPGMNMARQLEVELDLLEGTGSSPRALEKALKTVSPDSQNPRDHLWLGHIQWTGGKPEDAEKSFRKAIELNPKSAEGWVVLVLFLAELGAKDRAIAEIAQAKKALPQEQAAFALPVCYEAVGDTDKAREAFAALLKAKPDDPAALRAAATFHMRNGQTKEAIERFQDMENLTSHPEAVRLGRRNVALIWSAMGYEKNKEAEQRINRNLKERPDNPEDLRARALILALRPGGRRESIKTLEESFLKSRPTPAESLLLAQLYEADNNWRDANRMLQSVVVTPGGDTPANLTTYVRALLRHGELQEAALWLAKLRAKEPNSARTVELTARLEAKGDNWGKVAQIVKEFAEKDYAARKDPDMFGRAAILLDELDGHQHRVAEDKLRVYLQKPDPKAVRPPDPKYQLTGEIESLYRRFVKDTQEKVPANVLRLVGFLAQRKRPDEALKLLENSWEKCPVDSAFYAAAFVRVVNPSLAQLARIEAIVDQALAKQPSKVELRIAKADLLDARDQYSAAAKVYRAILDEHPNNVMALNNLAWLAALHEKRGQDALEMINKAIEVVGPIDAIVDTRGVIHLSMGQLHEAIKDFKDATDQNPEAVRFFHLAQAYAADKNVSSAQAAWTRANDLGLKEVLLHSLERGVYARLKVELPPAPPR